MQYQRSAVRIQSSANIYILLLTVEKTKIKDRETEDGPLFKKKSFSIKFSHSRFKFTDWFNKFERTNKNALKDNRASVLNKL